MNVAVDLDGVICDFTHSYVKVINYLLDKNLPSNYQPQRWDYYPDLTEVEMKAAWDFFLQKKNVWGSLLPLVGAEQLRSSMGMLVKNNINIYYVTNRPQVGGASSLIQTNGWLQEQLLLRENCSTIVVDGYTQKARIYRALKMDFSLDDKPETVRDCQTIPGHRAYLFDAAWNRAPEWKDLQRLNSVTSYLSVVNEAQRALEACSS